VSDRETCSSDEDSSTSGKQKKIKPANPAELDKMMFELIISNDALYSEILRYQPVYLSRFKTLLKTAPFSCNGPDLLDFLDRQVYEVVCKSVCTCRQSQVRNFLTLKHFSILWPCFKITILVSCKLILQIISDYQEDRALPLLPIPPGCAIGTICMFWGNIRNKLKHTQYAVDYLIARISV